MPFKIAIIGGAGYVGLTTGACLARDSHQVICLDIDKERVENLNKGIVPIYEEGMEVLVHDGLKKGRLVFTTDYKTTIDDSEILFLTLPTPTTDCEADLSYIFKALPEIAKHMNGYKIIVGKSTVPPGSGDLISQRLRNELENVGKNIPFDYVSNPEFLRQGSAVQDFLKPDRVVIGAESAHAKRIMDELYYTLKVRGIPIHVMSILEAETVKYASNAFLAVKISFVNSMANLCDALALNAYNVLEAWADDKRIGRSNMHPGPGFGGSCFPKDTEALASFARKAGVPQDVVEATIAVNRFQKTVLPRKVEHYFFEKGLHLKGMTFAVLGLSFKAETDDMRESSSIDTVNYLTDRGAKIRAYDPAANQKAKQWIGDKAVICPSIAETVKDVDAILILTDWNEFKQLDIKGLTASCRHKVIFDARNLFSRSPEKADEIKDLGVDYIGIGTRILSGRKGSIIK